MTPKLMGCIFHAACRSVLIAYAREEKITNGVSVSCAARTVLHGSVINRYVRETVERRQLL